MLDLSVQAGSSGVFFSRVKEACCRDGFHFHDVVRLVAKSLKEIEALRLERCGVGENGNGKGEWREINQAFERMFK